MPAKAKSVKLSPQLETFVEAKEKQAREYSTEAGENVSPRVWEYFKAARKGDWEKVSQLWPGLAEASGQYERSKAGTNAESAGKGVSLTWQPVLEVDLALRALAYGDPGLVEAFGRGIVDCIPRGAVYFGGTDYGRGLITAYSKSHADGDPCFTITQNAFANESYLVYLRRMYGGKIQIPSTDDSQKAFSEYLSDAQRRLEHDRRFPNEPKQIKPGEDVRTEGGQPKVSGQVAVMAINALLAKSIFDRNPERDFYVEESFPLDWMYPRLVPHEFILKLSRQPLAELAEADVLKDREFWNRQTKKYLGDWLNADTPVKDVCAFAEKVFLDRSLNGFGGDPAFARDPEMPKAFSKLRSSTAGVYAWRSMNSKSADEQKRMKQEAELAFRQSYAMCPTSPEALFRYVNLLIASARVDDAFSLAETSSKLDPANGQFRNLRQELGRIKAQQQR